MYWWEKTEGLWVTGAACREVLEWRGFNRGSACLAILEAGTSFK